MVENKGDGLTKDVVMNLPWVKQGETQGGTEKNKNKSDSNTQFQVCLFIAKILQKVLVLWVHICSNICSH